MQSLSGNRQDQNADLHAVSLPKISSGVAQMQ
jgi:hypothetical protein